MESGHVNSQINFPEIWKYSPGSADTFQRIILDPPPRSLDDACLRLPSGVYTTLCTFDEMRVLRLDDHLKRLEESSKLAGVQLEIRRPPVEKIILTALFHFSPANLRLRLVVDLKFSVGDIYLAAVPFQPPPASIYQDGVPVITVPGGRNIPLAKLTDYISQGSALREERQGSAYEILLSALDGEILEGTSSNFYGIISGVLFTACIRILEGITRKLVLEEVAKAGIQLATRGMRIDEIPLVQEAFLTSSTRGIVPISVINGITLPGQIPGRLTKLLMDRYANRLYQELEPLSSIGDSSSPGSESSINSPRS